MPEEMDPNRDMELAELDALADKWLGDFKRRVIHRRLDKNIITTIPDGKLWQAILDFIGLKIGQDWDHDVEKVPKLGPALSAVYFLSGLDIEVNNGGFNQFFYNRGKEAVQLAKHGADLLGLSSLAMVISKALEIELKERQKMAEVKETGTLEAFFESYEHISFDCADEEFMALDLDLGKAVVSFVRNHYELFEGQVDD